MRLSNEWTDYECIDAGNGEKLERWGNIILRRPEPQAMWPIDGMMLVEHTTVLKMVEVIGNLMKICRSIGQLTIKI